MKPEESRAIQSAHCARWHGLLYRPLGDEMARRTAMDQKQEFETEEEFLKAYKPSKYPRPSVTADIAVFSKVPAEEDDLQVLLIRRKNFPCRDMFALPGGFTNPDETVDQAAARELMEETGVKPALMMQLRTFSEPGRDPRGWTVTGTYIALVDAATCKVQAGDDAKDARWFRISLEGEGPLQEMVLKNGEDELVIRWEKVQEETKVDPSFKVAEQQGLAFDHSLILLYAYSRIKEILRQHPDL